MKHTIKTPQGTLTIEPVGLSNDRGVRVTVQKMPFPAFPLTIRPEDASAVYVALGLTLGEVYGEKLCGKVSSGVACTSPKGSTCPDCGPCLIDCGPGGVNAL